MPIELTRYYKQQNPCEQRVFKNIGFSNTGIIGEKLPKQEEITQII